jgi:hypothetical protein
MPIRASTTGQMRNETLHNQRCFWHLDVAGTAVPETHAKEYARSLFLFRDHVRFTAIRLPTGALPLRDRLSAPRATRAVFRFIDRHRGRITRRRRAAVLIRTSRLVLTFRESHPPYTDSFVICTTTRLPDTSRRTSRRFRSHVFSLALPPDTKVKVAADAVNERRYRTCFY